MSKVAVILNQIKEDNQQQYELITNWNNFSESRDWFELDATEDFLNFLQNKIPEIPNKIRRIFIEKEDKINKFISVLYDTEVSVFSILLEDLFEIINSNVSIKKSGIINLKTLCKILESESGIPEEYQRHTRSFNCSFIIPELAEDYLNEADEYILKHTLTIWNWKESITNLLGREFKTLVELLKNQREEMLKNNLGKCEVLFITERRI